MDDLEDKGYEALADLKQQDLRMGPITNQQIQSYGTYGCGTTSLSPQNLYAKTLYPRGG